MRAAAPGARLGAEDEGEGDADSLDAGTCRVACAASLAVPSPFILF